MQVENATQDERFHNNPLVTGALQIRFYAGMPIVSPTGHKVGTLCLIDHKPKTLSAEEERALKLLANQAAKLLEIRRKNRLLCDRSEEIISLKSRSIKRLIEDEEDRKQEISFKLHEDIAQTIAASIFCLQTAESAEDQNTEFVSKARGHLQKGLEDVRKLSYEIVPPSLHLLSAHGLIEEYIAKTATARPFSVTLLPAKKRVTVSTEHLLFLLRVTGDWLRILAKHTDTRNVWIRLSKDEVLCFAVSDDGTVDIETREGLIRQNALVDKVACLDGNVELMSEEDEKNALHINIPQANKSVQKTKRPAAGKERHH